MFLRQSANLHAYFYQVQVCVHRAFILPYHESPLSFPSLIICTNAARACIRLLDELCARIGTPVYRNLVRTLALISVCIRAVTLTWAVVLGYTELVRPSLVLQAVGEQAGRKRARGRPGLGIRSQVFEPD